MFQEQYKNHKIIFCPQNQLPPARLDDDKFQQIMTNLIDNGCKYSPEGSTITITTSTKDENIIINVRDEGVGIKKEDSDKLFKKFLNPLLNLFGIPFIPLGDFIGSL